MFQVWSDYQPTSPPANPLNARLPWHKRWNNRLVVLIDKHTILEEDEKLLSQYQSSHTLICSIASENRKAIMRRRTQHLDNLSHAFHFPAV